MHGQRAPGFVWLSFPVAKEFKYFSGEIELHCTFPMERALVRAKFPEGRIKKFDDFSLQVGTVSGRSDPQDFLPVSRIICFKTNGSRHKCDSRCRCAKGDECECECGGKFHGVDRAF